MEHIYNDIDFINIVEPILKDKNFLHTQSTMHHGLKKLDHSIKVAYYSYLYAKKFDLDCISVARGGLLHDFFYCEIKGNYFIDSTKLMFSHPNTALDNATKYFTLNDIEKDIICKHMFPVSITIPKYKESLLVALVDKIIGTGEFIKKGETILNFKILSKVIPTFIIVFGVFK